MPSLSFLLAFFLVASLVAAYDLDEDSIFLMEEEDAAPITNEERFMPLVFGRQRRSDDAVFTLCGMKLLTLFTEVTKEIADNEGCTKSKRSGNQRPKRSGGYADRCCKERRCSLRYLKDFYCGNL